VNLVGKILVIIVTVLSFAFLALAFAVVATPTNYRDVSAKRDAALKDREKQLSRLSTQNDELRKKLQEVLKAHGDNARRAATEMEQAQTAYRELREKLDAEKKKAAENTARAKLDMEEVKKRREDLNLLGDQLKKATQEKEEADRKKFERDQELVDLQFKIGAAEAENKDLKELEAALTVMCTEKGLPTSVQDRPVAAVAPDVEGLVLKVDGRLIEISLGSDDGLRPGHKLDVFRTEPKPQYLGRVVVEVVDADQAVCRVLPELKQGAIQERDLVSTRITPRR
jgi:hypothetical protein